MKARRPPQHLGNPESLLAPSLTDRSRSVGARH
jgi:hypothetical protein